MIESYDPYIERKLHAEPWRAGQHSSLEVCLGTPDYDGSPFWMCHTCGRIGTMHTSIHLPVRRPTAALLDFLRKVGKAFRQSRALALRGAGKPLSFSWCNRSRRRLRNVSQKRVTRTPNPAKQGVRESVTLA